MEGRVDDPSPADGLLNDPKRRMGGVQGSQRRPMIFYARDFLFYQANVHTKYDF